MAVAAPSAPVSDTRTSTATSFDTTATQAAAEQLTAADIRCVDQLRDFVHLALCRRENLLEFHFPMTEVELKKNGTICGLQFILHGPRRVKLAAVWAADRNEILMYAANGNRFRRVRLPNPVG
jgi:hypothetical protein